MFGSRAVVMEKSIGVGLLLLTLNSIFVLPLQSQPATSGGGKTFALGVSKVRNVSKVHAIEKLDLGNFNLFNGNTRQAIEAYKLALRINPDLWEAHYGLCTCYVRKHKMDLAMSECQKVLALKPKHKESVLLLANLLKSQGRLAESIKHYELAQSMGVKSSDLYTGLGLAQAQSGDLTGAVANLDTAIALAKKHINPQAHLGKAVVAFKLGDKQEALTELDIAIKEHGGKYTEARNFKAEILVSMGQLDGAKKEYQTEIKKEDPGPACFQALGNIYLKENNLVEAQKTFLLGSKWYPRDPDILLGLAVVLERQGQLPEAVLAYQCAIKRLREPAKMLQWQKHLKELEVLVAKR